MEEDVFGPVFSFLFFCIVFKFRQHFENYGTLLGEGGGGGDETTKK